MRIGYARTSTVEQVAGFEAQIDELTRNQCEKIFREQLSSLDANRLQLEAAIDFAREGDTFIVTKLDRLARSMRDFVSIGDRLSAKGVSLTVLSPSMDTATPAGRLMFNVFASVAQFEREIMLERQRWGIEKAKAEGKYSKPRNTGTPKRNEVLAAMESEGGASKAARKLGISRTTLYRVMKGEG